MYSFKIVEEHSQWGLLTEQHPEASLQQSWQWGDVSKALGHDVLRVLIMHDDALVGGMSCIVKNARRGRYLEVPGGPLIDWTDIGLVDACLTHLRQIAREQSCVFVRFRPQLEDSKDHRQLLRESGAREALMHISADHTSIIDLSPDLDTLLANMRQQTRYEVRRAPRRDVTVRQIRGTTALDTFHQLHVDTAKRQNFIPPSRRYLDACADAFGDDAKIYEARKGSDLLNIAMVLWFGHEAAYFEAASTPQARKDPGAYAVVWQAMQDAKAVGLQYFNLWGTAPPDRPNHRYAGVTTFKRGFGGRDVAYVPAHDLVIKPLQYRLTRAFEYARKRRRKL